MAWALHVDKLETGGKIFVRHTFFGEKRRECEQRRNEHAAGCKAFGPALEEEKVIEIWEEIDELPEWVA